MISLEDPKLGIMLLLLLKMCVSRYHQDKSNICRCYADESDSNMRFWLAINLRKFFDKDLFLVVQSVPYVLIICSTKVGNFKMKHTVKSLWRRKSCYYSTFSDFFVVLILGFFQCLLFFLFLPRVQVVWQTPKKEKQYKGKEKRRPFYKKSTNKEKREGREENTWN